VETRAIAEQAIALAQAVRLPKLELNQWIDSATHLIYHALFTDPPGKRGAELQ